MITKPDPSVHKEIEEQRPRFPVGMLSRREKDTLVERGLIGLYRWYLARSQESRNWNPDLSFDWRSLRTDHSPVLCHVIEGFYAVEQFVPDYTAKAIDLVRKSYGRSHFQIRWGAEEEKHADMWLNAMLFLRHRSPEWIRDYREFLHEKSWDLPWDDVIHLNCYVVIQERATQLNYLNTLIAAQGKSDNPELANDADPVLAKAAHTIAVDEAAHYHFFLEVARLFLYYYPAETLQALQDVIKYFSMPALDLIKVMPDQVDFEEATYRAGIYTARHYLNDVLKVALKHFVGVDRRTLGQGIKKSRLVPDQDGNLRDATFFEEFSYDSVEKAVQKIYGRIQKHEELSGHADVDPTQFIPTGMGQLKPDLSFREEAKE